VTDYINDKIRSSFISDRKNIQKIKSEYNSLCNINIDALFDEKKAFWEEILKEKNYAKALANCNLKKCLTQGLGSKIVNDFETRVLEYINRTPEIKNLIIEKYLSNIPKN